MAMKGKRMYLSYTREELTQIFPLNQGQVRPGWYTLLGEVTEEETQGIWFRLEKVWMDQTELKPQRGDVPLDPPVYFIQWDGLRRPILPLDDGTRPAGPPIGQYL